MEPLNDNMDELFRKAGDLYPLKISESDWEAVQGRLKEDNFEDRHGMVGIQARQKRNLRRWFLLLLLIPLGLGGLIYYSGSPKKVKRNPAFNTYATPVNPKPPTKDALSGKGAGNPALHSMERTNPPESEKVSSQNKSNPSFPVIAAQNPAIHANSSASKSKTHITDKMESAGPSIANQSLASKESTKEPQARPVTVSVAGLNKSAIVSPLFLTSHKSPDISLTGTALATKKKAAESKIQTSKGFYVGFLAGPDLSSVNFQAVNQPGFSLGLTVGYRINDRFSVETGILWDKKYYYSTGSYFNKQNTSIPVYDSIQSLNGFCNMFEIPLLLRFDFASRNNHRFYAKAGFSSYLMKKEHYDINAISGYGNAVNYPYTYNNSTKNILSIFQLSAGYEHTVSQKFKIQIEPYLKIPLQGIGIGKMPISSAGLYLGISYSFH